MSHEGFTFTPGAYLNYAPRVGGLLHHPETNGKIFRADLSVLL